MEFHQLRYFVEVARQKNFSRAARACHVAQPSLSQQLKKLENELGQPLFRRGRKGAELTDFGRACLPQAHRILSAAHEMTEQAATESKELAGRVRLGAIPTVAPYLFPRLIRRVAEVCPKMRLNIIENTTSDLVKLLREGQLDVAFMSPPFASESEMEVKWLLDDELLVALPTGHPLASSRRLDLSALTLFPMVRLKDVHCLSRQSVSLCEASGLTPHVSFEYAQLETVVSMVEAGMGFSFVPQMALPAFQNRQLAFASLAPSPVTRQIVLAWSKYQNLNTTQLAFLDLALADEWLQSA